MFVFLAVWVSAFVMTPGAFALTGGPDRGGYTFYDSRENGVAAFSWKEISGAATLGGSGGTCDFKETKLKITPAIDLGFNFKFYGNTYSKVYISIYGYITFEGAGGNYAYFLGEPIPKIGGRVDNYIAGVMGALAPYV